MDIARKIERLDIVDAYVRKWQTILIDYEISQDERELMSVVADLLTTIDIVKKDIYWHRKDLCEKMAQDTQEYK